VAEKPPCASEEGVGKPSGGEQLAMICEDNQPTGVGEGPKLVSTGSKRKHCEVRASKKSRTEASKVAASDEARSNSTESQVMEEESPVIEKASNVSESTATSHTLDQTFVVSSSLTTAGSAPNLGERRPDVTVDHHLTPALNKEKKLVADDFSSKMSDKKLFTDSGSKDVSVVSSHSKVRNSSGSLSASKTDSLVEQPTLTKIDTRVTSSNELIVRLPSRLCSVINETGLSDARSDVTGKKDNLTPQTFKMEDKPIVGMREMDISPRLSADVSDNKDSILRSVKLEVDVTSDNSHKSMNSERNVDYAAGSAYKDIPTSTHRPQYPESNNPIAKSPLNMPPDELLSRDHYVKMEQMRQMYSGGPNSRGGAGGGAPTASPYGYSMDPAYHLHLMAASPEYRNQYERWMLEQKRMYAEMMQNSSMMFPGGVPGAEELKPVDMSSKRPEKSSSEVSHSSPDVRQNMAAATGYKKQDVDINGGSWKTSNESARKSFQSSGGEAPRYKLYNETDPARSRHQGGTGGGSKDGKSSSTSSSTTSRKESSKYDKANVPGNFPDADSQRGSLYSLGKQQTSSARAPTHNFQGMHFQQQHQQQQQQQSVAKAGDSMKHGYISRTSSPALSKVDNMRSTSSSPSLVNSKLLPPGIYPPPDMRGMVNSNPLLLDKDLGAKYANDMMMFESRTALDLLQQRAASLHNSGGSGRTSRSPFTESNPYGGIDPRVDMKCGKDNMYPTMPQGNKDMQQHTSSASSLRGGGQPPPSLCDSPPAKRHLHTHHHTHVINTPYPHPLYGQYAG